MTIKNYINVKVFANALQKILNIQNTVTKYIISHIIFILNLKHLEISLQRRLTLEIY